MKRMTGLPIYLASSSPRRRKLLKAAGVWYRVIKPAYDECDETASLRARPDRLVKTHALGKALSCAGKIEEGILLAADTIVWCGGKICGKPKGRKEAVSMLAGLQGRWHRVYTGVCLLKIQKYKIARQSLFAVKTSVRIKKMTRSGIRRYFKRIHPLDKAGAYAIQSSRACIVERIRGPFENAVGLPFGHCLKILKRWGAALTAK